MERIELTELKMSETDIPKDFLYDLYEFASYQYVPLWGLCYGISKHVEIKVSPLEADELFEMVCESSELLDYINSNGVDVLNTVGVSDIDSLDESDSHYADEGYEREVRPLYYYE